MLKTYSGCRGSISQCDREAPVFLKRCRPGTENRHRVSIGQQSKQLDRNEREDGRRADKILVEATAPMNTNQESDLDYLHLL